MKKYISISRVICGQWHKNFKFHNFIHLFGIFLGSIWPIIYGLKIVTKFGIPGMISGYILISMLILYARYHISNKAFDYSILILGILKLIPFISIVIGILSIKCIQWTIGFNRNVAGFEFFSAFLITMVYGLISMVISFIFYRIIVFMQMITKY